MTAIIVIPARYGSTRYPGKPLARQTGKFLIQHVVEQAGRAKRANRVVVATDDQRIVDAVHSFGGHAVMTAHTHLSGTDRIAEVMRKPEYTGVQVVVNVQGDEPEIDPGLIDDLIRVTSQPDGKTGKTIEIATAAAAFENAREIENSNIVKVVVDQRQLALYFSRSVIPFDRDHIASGTHAPHPPTAAAHPAAPAALSGIYRKHLGIYAYRREALLALATAPMCELERLEKLEQLRALYLGFRIYVQDTTHATHGIDTPEDYAAFVKRHQETVKL